MAQLHLTQQVAGGQGEPGNLPGGRGLIARGQLHALRSGAYRQMAYTDALTGLANRTAFEEKLRFTG